MSNLRNVPGLHNLGSSVNCLGRRLTTYTTRDAKEIRKILVQLP